MREYCDDVTVKRNDEISVEQSDEFSHIVISPGPGLPKDSGILMELLKRQAKHKPILGICLGMQALAQHFGGSLYNQKKVKHGVTAEMEVLSAENIFKNLPQKITVGLYHSWAVDENTLPTDFTISAKSNEGVLMAIEHKELPVYGVQFHPESILTHHGKDILNNWLSNNP